MEFVTPALGDTELLREYLRDNKYRACELAVANNVMWSSYYESGFMIVSDMLVFARMDNGKPSMVSFPMGHADEKKAFDELLHMFEDNNVLFNMFLVSEKKYERISEWYPGRFSIEYDRDSADYLYTWDTLANLRGKKLHGKRNHINKFLEEHPDYEYELINEHNKEECMQLEEAWLSGAEISKSGAYERDAIRLALDNMERLRLKGALIRVDGKICAFTIGEELTEDTYVIHFEKADSQIQGAYPMINREFVRRELTGYEYINREDDMGIPGLRYAKSTYQPIELIKKGVVKAI